MDMNTSNHLNTIAFGTTNAGSFQLIPSSSTPVAAPPNKTTSKEPNVIAGGAPEKTLFTRYVQVKSGYVGQVVHGDPARRDTGLVVWESNPMKRRTEAKSKDAALHLADQAIEQSLASLFKRVTVSEVADDDEDDD